jgi:hypothetical protein
MSSDAAPSRRPLRSTRAAQPAYGQAAADQRGIRRQPGPAVDHQCQADSDSDDSDTENTGNTRRDTMPGKNAIILPHRIPLSSMSQEALIAHTQQLFHWRNEGKGSEEEEERNDEKEEKQVSTER